ncbi:MAG: hypothetical protein Q8L64_02045, partial [bacterium]|nr:hypothetical protein [bacterium]
MNEKSLQENLQRIRQEYEYELQILQSQQVFTKLDAQKIMAQAEVTKNAMFNTRDESSFNDRAKEKLLNALIRDFEKSIQRTLDEAVGRKGDKALLIYKLNRIDRKIGLKAIDINVSQSDLKKLEIGMELLKSYIVRSLPEKSNSLWSTSKID